MRARDLMAEYYRTVDGITSLRGNTLVINEQKVAEVAQMFAPGAVYTLKTPLIEKAFSGWDIATFLHDENTLCGKHTISSYYPPHQSSDGTITQRVSGYFTGHRCDVSGSGRERAITRKTPVLLAFSETWAVRGSHIIAIEREFRSVTRPAAMAR